MLVEELGVGEMEALVLVQILRIDHDDVVDNLAASIRLVDPPKKKGGTPKFGIQEIALVGSRSHQVADMRRMGNQPVVQDNDLQVWLAPGANRRESADRGGAHVGCCFCRPAVA